MSHPKILNPKWALKKLGELAAKALMVSSIAGVCAGQALADEEKVLFCIGTPDASPAEFGAAKEGSKAFANTFPDPVIFTVGKSRSTDWPYIHPGTLDQWAGAKAHTYTVRFNLDETPPKDLKLILGVMGIDSPGTLVISLNQKEILSCKSPNPSPTATSTGLSAKAVALVVPVPEGLAVRGANTLTICLNDGARLTYDYLMLAAGTRPIEKTSDEILTAQPDSSSWRDDSRPFQTAISVDASKAVFRMAGGIGASWHAIQTELPHDGRGSAWGGNPPMENKTAWEQVRKHARWLGLDFVRVEFDQRMYEPERARFDWDNAEMQGLYRILDACQANGADVFFQQMWSHVEWNKIEGVEALHSAPRSVEDFAEGYATLVEYLVHKRGYTCIRWLCITNEPGSPWGWWKDAKGNISITEGLRATRKALDARGISLPIAGPDWSRLPSLPPLNPAQLDFDDALGAYDLHTYMGLDANAQKTLENWAKWAHDRSKPFFLAEFGDLRLGRGRSNPWPKSYAAVLSNAEVILRGLAVGVDGFNRWSFLNRGNLDGQWQLVRTYDIGSRKYLDEAVPEPVPYYGYGLFTRFSAPNSEVLSCRVTGSGQRFLAGALRSPKGNLTIWLLNLSSQQAQATMRLEGLGKEVALTPYPVTEAALGHPDFTHRPGEVIRVSPGSPEVPLTVPARSVTAFTTYRLAPEDPGITRE